MRDKLIEIAVRSKADEQMPHREYECLIALIDYGTISTVEQLAEYIDITEVSE